MQAALYKSRVRDIPYHTNLAVSADTQTKAGSESDESNEMTFLRSPRRSATPSRVDHLPYPEYQSILFFNHPVM